MHRFVIVAAVAALGSASRLTAAEPETVVKIGKLSAPAPADWKKEKRANLLRSYQFRLPAGVPDTPDAEVVLFPQSDPVPAKAFPKWRAHFTPPEGKPGDDLGLEGQFELPAATVHLLDVTGTWKYKERPFDPKSKEEVLPDYRVVWAIVAEKGGDATHVRLSGPSAVVGRHYSGFEKWLKALK